MELRKVEAVPPRNTVFEMSKETEELIGSLNGLEVGEVMECFISENNGKEEAQKESNKVFNRLQTAVKHAEGYFKVYRRRYSIFIEKKE